MLFRSTYTATATNGKTYDFIPASGFNNYIRLGFNPNDYTQQLTLYYIKNYAGPVTLGGYTTSTTGVDANAAILVDSNGAAETKTISGIDYYIRTFEIQLSKAAIEEQYGTDLDFSSMFIGLMGCDDKWADSNNQKSSFWVFGTVTTDSNFKTTYIPDCVVFDAMCPGASADHNADNCDYTVIDSSEGNCTTDKFVRAKCDKCGVEFDVSRTTAPGHNYKIEGKKAICNVCTFECIHTFTKDPTKCDDCGILKSVVDACEHTNGYTEATCTQPSTCKLGCGHTIGEAAGHKYVSIAAKAPTCVGIGWDAHEKCSVCKDKQNYTELLPTRWNKGATQAVINAGDHTSLLAYGQKIYATGLENYYASGDSFMYLNAAIDGHEPYVCVTPNYVDRVGISATDGTGYTYGYSTINTTSVNDYATQIKYYVAQDEENVYLLIEDYAPYVEQNKNGIFDDCSESILRNQIYSINVGFDTANYERAVYFRINGDTVTSNIDRKSTRLNSSHIR